MYSLIWQMEKTSLIEHLNSCRTNSPESPGCLLSVITARTIGITFWSQQGYLILICRKSAESQAKPTSNHMSQVSILKRIKNVTNAFTLYLKETNRITVPADINTINGILSVILKLIQNINIAITEQVWEDVSLNPLKADRTARGRKYHSKSNQHKYSKKNHTLIKQLQPYFKGVYNYKPYSQN